MTPSAGSPTIQALHGVAKLHILRGVGDGTFQPPVQYAFNLIRVITVDLNGDGRLDLAGAGTPSGTVAILNGNGDGSFQSPLNFPAGDPVVDLDYSDFNQDGTIDLVAATYHHTAGGMVSVLLG